jgi:putative transposase
MDVCKIAQGLYQYKAIDDCSRYKVMALFKRRMAANSIAFLEQVTEEMAFPIQRIQTDRGQEFFAVNFQKRLMEWGIKFRPIKPGSPHLNGKVLSEQTSMSSIQPWILAVRTLRSSCRSGSINITGIAPIAP